MSYSQSYPTSFDTVTVTNQALKNLDNETKKIYQIVNEVLASDGHDHTGNGSDGAKIDYSNLLNKPDVVAKNETPINVMYPPIPMVGAKGDNTTIDDAAIDAILALGKSVYFPKGKYVITKPLNLTNRKTGNNNYGNRRIYGDGKEATVFKAYTGIYPAIDLTGSSRVTLEDFGIVADNVPLDGTSNAKIGIVNRRGTTASLGGYCHFNNFRNIKINLMSDLTANGDAGTIGILHFGGEHCHYSDMEVYANLPLYAGNQLNVTVSSGYDLDSVNYEQPATTSTSCGVCMWDNLALIAYDSARVASLYQLNSHTFTDIYTSNRLLVGTWSALPESFMVHDCSDLKLQVFQETSGIVNGVYRLDHRFLTISANLIGCDIKIKRVMSAATSFVGAVQPFIYFTDTNNAAIIRNSNFDCQIDIANYNNSGDLIQITTPITAGASYAKPIRNCTFTLDKSGRDANFFSAVSSYIKNCKGINYISGNTWINDNYEEGTWTPTLRMGTTGLAFTTSTATGTYIKTGKMVTATFHVTCSAKPASGSNLVISLPIVSTAYQTIAGYITKCGGVTFTGENYGAGATQITVGSYDSAGNYAVIGLIGSARSGVDTIGLTSLTTTCYISGVIVYQI